MTQDLVGAPERLLTLLGDAVGARLRNRGRVACHLSGGLDSSAVTVMAARQLRAIGEPPPIGFSWSAAPIGEPQGEQQAVEAVAHQEQLETVYCPLSALDLRLALEGRPAFGSPLHEGPVAQAIVRAGCTVVLSGWGGDQCASFDGVGYHVELLLSGRWGKLWNEARALAQQVQRPVWEVWKNWVLAPLLPGWVWRILGKHRAPVAQAWLDSGQVGHLDDVLPGMEKIMIAAGRARFGKLGTRQQRLAGLSQPGLHRRLEAWALLGGRCGIEYRYPLLDRRILDFGMSLPGDAFVQGGVRRHLFRRAVGHLLPAGALLFRTKAEPWLVESSEAAFERFWEIDCHPKGLPNQAYLRFLRALH